MSGVTLGEYARQCRETCDRKASAKDGRDCGESRVLADGETAYSFCGHHWRAVLDADEEHEHG